MDKFGKFMVAMFIFIATVLISFHIGTALATSHRYSDATTLGNLSYYTEGEVVPLYNGTGYAVSLGDIVLTEYGSCGVCKGNIASTGTGSVAIKGAWKSTKDSTATWSVGAPIYWSGAETTTTLETGYLYLGRAYKTASSGTTDSFVTLAPFSDAPNRVITVAATATLDVHDFYSDALVLASGTTSTITLPAVASIPKGARMTFKKTGNNANAITIDGNGAETIDGAATNTAMDAIYDTITIQSTGAAWVITSRYIQ